MKTETVNYSVRFLVRTVEGVSSFKEDFGPDLVRARNVYLELRKNLGPEQVRFLSLQKDITTHDYTALE